MPNITKWELEVFRFGDFISDRIDFSIEDHNFFMVFTPVKALGEENMEWTSEEVGLFIPDNSYVIKFDRIENFESGKFYDPPSDKFSRFDFRKLRRLGGGIRKLIEFHYSLKNTEIYFASAESLRMKRYYDRLIKKYSSDLHFEVISDIGKERLNYAIRTKHYRNKEKKN